MKDFEKNMALLLVAHGSRRSLSNDEVRHLAMRLAQRGAGRFQWVSAAFLELAKPSIPEAIDACVARGAEEVVVLPYFLSRGRHVAEDVPAIIQQKRSELPGVEIRLADHIGASPAMLDLLLAASS